MSRQTRTTMTSCPGGIGELVRLALPLILSNSFWFLQLTLDRVFLSRLGSADVAAAMPAALLFWTPLTLLQNTANYATTFVAQYVGAGREHRVGPAVWQAIYFSFIAGVGFLGILPLTDFLVGLGGHSPAIAALEIVYFRCLCFSAAGFLITAATSSFFAGRGDSWTVLLINGFGVAVNGPLAYAWIFGEWGLPAMGIEGAGWATVVGSSSSALLGLFLFTRKCWEGKYATRRGYKLDPALFKRLLRFGIPNGLQWALDCLAITVFTLLIGRLGDAELAATSIAFTLNMVAFLPSLGAGQAVGILVGQRLGENQPALAARSTWSGFRLVWSYMAVVALLYVTFPNVFLTLFQGSERTESTAKLAVLIPVLLRFVAVYCLFDSMNVVFSCALRGAGDTFFVTLVTLGLSWPVMVVPSWASWYFGWGLYWAWVFFSAYVICLAFIFLLRFRHGKWKSMRVIETPAIPPAPARETEWVSY